MHVTAERLEMPLERPFRISRGTQEQARSLLVTVEHEGITGIGEAAPDSSGFYGESVETMLAALPRLSEALGDDLWQREDALAAMEHAVHHGHGALKSALDMALWDYAGKRLGVPVYRLLGLDPARAPVSSFTIGIDTPERMAEVASRSPQWSILKLKVGTPNDLETLRAVRGATSATLRVDANAAWTPKEALARIEALVPFGIEFVEQPVAAHDLEGLRFVRERSPLPIIADESCVTLTDVARVTECADGINIKLAKCGGITNALKLIAAARANSLSVMLGCMVSSSVATTAAAQLSPLVDYADLDGAALLAADPFSGVSFGPGGTLLLPEAPGLGVHRRDET
jgi:L-Ala-D/L-Glu epimerase / N-acetyl-D-glutamate racemase